MAEITLDEAKRWTMHEEMHLNGGKDFFGYIHRCNQQPRLSRYDRYQKSDRSVTSTWRVDGVDQVDFETAVAALNQIPSFTQAELDLLATVGDEPEDRRKEMVAGSELWDSLTEKAAIEWKAGRVRRTEAGRAALAAKAEAGAA